MSWTWQSALPLALKTLPLLPVVIAFNDLVASIAVVGGRSMQPTLNPLLKDDNKWWSVSDRILLDKLSVRFQSISPFKLQKGDVVVLKSPSNPRERVVKRLVGCEGDWVKSKDGRPVFVPAGHCWVEGDNEDFSTDSNSYGPIALALLDARAVAVM